MTQEDKELLLKDLCVRLLYRVVCLLYANGTSITEELKIGGLEQFMLGSLEVKPYLRPMSSMTKEEKERYLSFHYRIEHLGQHDISISNYMDWLNAHHFDYRGLIEKGLALKATEGMYDLKEK